MTAIDKLREISIFLESKGIEDAVRESEMLIAKVLHVSKTQLYSSDLKISTENYMRLQSYAGRRADGEPLQYIMGHVDFMGLKIHVGPGVLIPRPETEILAEEAIRLIKQSYNNTVAILDLCSGSGCLALAIAKAFPDADVYGVDISDEALKFAMINAESNHIGNVSFMNGNLFEPVVDLQFDCIVSNPPYIRTHDINNLQREIKEHEPINALDGGEDGLDFYRMIIGKAPRYLNKNGIVIFELGFEQADDVHAIAACSGFSNVSFVKDYSGIRRICIIKQ